MFDLVQHRKPKKLEAFVLIIILSIIYTSIVGFIISIINNNYTLQGISEFLFGGFSKVDLPQNIASLLNRGGISKYVFYPYNSNFSS